VSGPEPTAESFGRSVLGPIVAEFCLRLWSLGSMMDRPADATYLFCARGGLRMQQAYERFLAAADLPSPVAIAPLMVSRVVAIRPALVHTLKHRLETLPDAAATTLRYEFPRASVADVATAMTGTSPRVRGSAWEAPFTPAGFAALLRDPDGQPVADALTGQAELFDRHLRAAINGRGHAVLVDTGLYGTTRLLLAEGLPDISFSSALIARSFRPGPPNPRTFGLSVEAKGYSPARRRTALLRYWHFVEWLFEPPLPSVRSFIDEHGTPRSNLEIDGWRGHVDATPGTAYAGLLDYLDALPPHPAEMIALDADRAWGAFRRAVVWPRHAEATALSVGTRSHDFGTDGTWDERTWRGAAAALRGSSMWRGGEIARSGTKLRLPLLAAIEIAYSARHVRRAAGRPLRRLHTLVR
jgi:hypothetical protein